MHLNKTVCLINKNASAYNHTNKVKIDMIIESIRSVRYLIFTYY